MALCLAVNIGSDANLQNEEVIAITTIYDLCTIISPCRKI